jgi:hypothetical protein
MHGNKIGREPVMHSNSRHVFAAAMLGDQFVGSAGHLSNQPLVDTAARRPSTDLEIDLVVVLDELSRVLLEKLMTDGFLHVPGFVQASRLVEHKTVSRP